MLHDESGPSTAVTCERVWLRVAFHDDNGFEDTKATLKVRSDDPRIGDPQADADAYAAALLEGPKTLTPDADGLEEALWRLGWLVAYDLRSQQMWLRRTGEQWTQATDRKIAAIKREMSSAFTTPQNQPLAFGRIRWPDAINALLDDRETDFFGDWLDTLDAWDGHRRVDGWLHSCFDIDPGDELAAWASRFLLLGAVARCRQPGAKLDETPVLVGPQGIGKSTALRWLLPPGRWGDRWFCDGLHLAADPKQRAETLQGRVIVEVSEMAGSSRADLESLKAFLSRTDDGSVRLAYRHNPETSPRRAILCGTTNTTESLPNDVTGNRRFVVVELNGGNPTFVREYLDANRIQMWAEAVALHREGAPARLPDHLKAAQADRNETHRRRDAILEDAVEAWLARTASSTFALPEAAVGAGLVHTLDAPSKLSRRDEARLTAALRSAGCNNTREYVDGRRKRIWSKPVGHWDGTGHQNPYEDARPLLNDF